VSLYDGPAIDKLADALRDAIKPSRVSQALGIPQYCLASMIYEGLISLVSNPDVEVVKSRGDLISERSVEAFIEKLAQAPLQPSHPERAVALSAAMGAVVDPTAWAHALAAVMNGTLPVRAWGPPSDGPIGRIRVESDDLTQILAGSRERSAPIAVNLSCSRVAEALDTSTQFVSAATAAGYFDGTRTSRSIEVALESVRSFNEQYMLPAEAAKLLGRSGKAARRHILNSGITPVDYVHKVSIWRRSDVERIAAKPSS
jgi:hypothetical protein